MHLSVLLGIQDPVSVPSPIDSGFYNNCASSSASFSEPSVVEFDEVIPFRVEYSKVSHSLNVIQLPLCSFPSPVRGVFDDACVRSMGIAISC